MLCLGTSLIGCFILSNREGSAQIGSTFLSLAALLLLCFWKCASGINDKDTVVVTDGELGKKLPGRNLEIDQEGQKGLTDEKMRGDFLDLNHFNSTYSIYFQKHYCEPPPRT